MNSYKSNSFLKSIHAFYIKWDSLLIAMVSKIAVFAYWE
jgi:hypothetical protein